MRRKAQPEGCIAALPRRYPAKPGRTLPCASQGTISALRAGTSYRLRSETPPAGGSARIVPPNLTPGLPSPFHRPFALHCRACVHARRGSLRRVEHFGFAQTLPRKALRYRKPPSGGRKRPPYKASGAGGGPRKRQPLPGPPAGRKGTCKARCRTPPPPAAASGPAAAAEAPLEGELSPKGTEGCIAAEIMPIPPRFSVNAAAPFSGARQRADRSNSLLLNYEKSCPIFFD